MKRKRKGVMRKRRGVGKFLKRTGGNFGAQFGGKISHELKYYDISNLFSANYQLGYNFSKDNTLINVAGPWSSMLLNAPTQGSDAINRIGRKILVKSLLFRADVSWICPTVIAPSGVNDVPPMRYILLIDKQSNGAQPLFTEVLRLDISTTNFLTAPLNLNNRDRFVVLADKVIQFQQGFYVSATAAYSYSQRKEIKIYKKLNTEVVFTGAGAGASSPGAAADVATNAMWILFISEMARAVTSDVPICPVLRSVNSRVRFYDA